MKFIITKNKLDNTVSSMQAFLEKKDDSAITSHIFMQIEDDILTLKASDHEIGLKYEINDITNSELGKATVNGSNLLGIIKRLKEDEIILETKDNNLIIKQNRSTFKLPMYNPEEYPKFVHVDDLKKIEISAQNLISAFKQITPAIDNHNPKFELNGALIDIQNNKINFVATDTRRLAISHMQNFSNETAKIIIPKKAIIEIQKLFLDDVNISYDETNLIISSEGKQFFTKLINGTFPEYERIIPNEYKYKFSIPKNSFVESIKLVTSLFSNIKITFSSNNIVFESLDENTESKTQIDLDLEITDSFYLAVNAKFLLDFLSTSNNENILIGFNESGLPFFLEDDKFFTIIMPIILDK